MCRPPLIAGTVAVVLCVAYLCAPLMGGDLSAQLARADFAGAHPVSPVDLRWFGGTQPFGYSLWVPALMAALTARVVGAIAAVVATVLATRLMQRAGASRPVVGGIAAAVCQASNLAEGRVAFAAGLAFALATIDLLSGRFRWRYSTAVVTAVLAGAANPVAALLLWLCALVALLRRQVLAAAVLVLASAIPVAVIAGVFSEGGRQLFNTTDAIRAALASLLVAIVVPTRHQIVRLGAVLGLVMVAAAYLLPTPVGGNSIRLTLLFAVPVVAAFVDWRPWLAALAVIAAIVVQTPVTLGTLTGAGAPATDASYYTPLLNEIKAQGQLTGRVEVPEENGHWESYYVARHVPLARGWLRQLDTELNDDVFYKFTPTAASYQTFLTDNAVEFVAVPDARLTYYGKRESALINGGLSYLDPIWRNDHWTLYRVANAVPIVEAPGVLVSMNADSLTFTAPPGSSVKINVRWLRWLDTSTADGSCISRSGDRVIYRTGTREPDPHVARTDLEPQFGGYASVLVTVASSRGARPDSATSRGARRRCRRPLAPNGRRPPRRPRTGTAPPTPEPRPAAVRPTVRPGRVRPGAARPHRPVHRRRRRRVSSQQPREGLCRGAHLFEQHDPAVVDVQQRLDRQRRAEPGRSRPDPAAPAQILQRVDVEQHASAVDRGHRGVLYLGRRRTGRRRSRRRQRGESQPHSGRPGIDHPYRPVSEVLSGQPGRLPGARQASTRCGSTPRSSLRRRALTDTRRRSRPARDVRSSP